MKWIPVTERLPEGRMRQLLVTYHPCYGVYVDKTESFVGIDSFCGKRGWAKKAKTRVIAWQELPNVYKPPKEKKADNENER